MKQRWIRIFDRDGTLVPIPIERADSEHQRAEAAQAEVDRLRAPLGRRDPRDED